MWHWGHRQQQWQGDRRQENPKRRLGSRGGSQGVPHSARGDAPPTPVVLVRGAASAEKREGGGGKGVIPPPKNKLKRCEEILLCSALPCSWHRHVPGQQVHLANRGKPGGCYLQLLCTFVVPTGSLRYYYQTLWTIHQYLSASEPESTGATCVRDLHLHPHTAVHGAPSARPTAGINSNVPTTHHSALHLP